MILDAALKFKAGIVGLTKMPNNKPSLARALSLAERGIPSFPCLPDKRPACASGFKAATVMPAGLRRLFAAHPDARVGVPTGEVSGFDVLDIDTKNGGMEWWQANRHLIPATRSHSTRSGGLHVLFRHHPGLRCSASKIAPGVDVRADGGYVIWWPAAGLPVLMDRALTWWPAWLTHALTPPPTIRLPSNVVSMPIGRTSSERIIAAVLAKVRNAADGQRHYNLRRAALTIGGLLDIAGIGEAEARKMLVQAAKDAGAADLQNAENTAAWGLQTGRSKPLNLGV